MSTNIGNVVVAVVGAGGVVLAVVGVMMLCLFRKRTLIKGFCGTLPAHREKLDYLEGEKHLWLRCTTQS